MVRTLIARVLSLLSIATVVVASASLYRPGPEAVLVLVAPGLDLNLVRANARSAPTLAALVASGVSGRVLGVDRLSSDAFWRGVLAGETTETRDGGMLWQRIGASRRVVVGMPASWMGEVEASSPASLVGDDLEHGYIGSNTFSVVDRSEIGSARLPWPYVGATDAARQELEGLPEQGWSGWVDLPVQPDSTRGGGFRMHTLDDERVLLTPVHAHSLERPTGLEAGGNRWVTGTPILLGLDEHAASVAYGHLVEVEARRASVTARLAGAAADLVVYRSPLVERVLLYAAAEEDDGLLLDALARTDAALQGILAALPEAATVVLLGSARDETGRISGSWSVTTSMAEKGLRTADVGVVDVYATLAALVGVPIDAGFVGRVPAVVRQRVGSTVRRAGPARQGSGPVLAVDSPGVRALTSGGLGGPGAGS